MTTTSLIAPASEAVPVHAMRALKAWSAIAFAAALTLCMQGYQFGESNHTVYLLDALHRLRPELLANDWFTTQTFQYHALFGLLTIELMRLHILEPAFLVGYLALVILMYRGWWRLVQALGGGVRVFVTSVVLFHVAAAGTGLGMYQFLQDSSFLPSNISAIALLWAIVLWLEKRHVAACVAMGVAAAFHLNYALIVVGMWAVLFSFDFRRRRFDRAFWLGGGVSLAEFVDLYVRLRHPHHYDPSSWPMWLWLSFILPLPPAVWMFVSLKRTGRMTHAWEQMARIFLMFCLILVGALLAAGITYA